MSRSILVAMLVAGTMLSTVGCATKKYVRNQVAPINNKIGELDEITAKNSRDITDVDGKAQQGIQAANQADQKALAAGESADQANQKAAHLGTGLNGLQGTVENLDNFKAVGSTTVQFRPSQWTLTKLSRRRADSVIQYLAAKHNIPPFRIYVIGMGEANPVAENNHSAGRAKNRRVEVQLMTNSLESSTSASAKPPSQPQASNDRQ